MDLNKNNERADASAIIAQLMAARDRMRNQPGGRNVEYGSVLDGLAWAQVLSGNLEAAQHALDEALMVREQLFPEAHLEVTLALDRLATLAAHRNDQSRAEETIQRMLRIRIAKLGPAHLATMAIMHRLAASFIDWGRSANAEGILRRVTAAREEALGVQNLVTASSVVLLAQACSDVGKRDEAERLFARSLDTQARLLDAKSGELLETRERYKAFRENRPFKRAAVSDDAFQLPWMNDNKYITSARESVEKESAARKKAVALDVEQYTDLASLETAFVNAEDHMMQSLADRAWQLLEEEAARRASSETSG